jgi:hypothetical protein
MLPKGTPKAMLLVALVVGIAAIGLVRFAPFGLAAASQDDADVAAKIETAMAAGPPAISADATIYDLELDDAGNFVVLREGSNGWSCFPDAPGTPGIDPQCLDQTWMAWLAAYVAGEEPDTQVVGLAYMLQGGSDPSNTDPMATEPAAGEDWVTIAPHVMLIVPADMDLTDFSTDHTSGEPYVMYADTPYAHIMMPVAEGEHEQ